MPATTKTTAKVKAKAKAKAKEVRPPKPSVLLLKLEKVFDNGKRWCKGRFELMPGGMAWLGRRQVVYPKGAFCMVGGLMSVNANNARVRVYLDRTAGGKSIIGKNDAPATTWPEIRSWLHKARKLALANDD